MKNLYLDCSMGAAGDMLTAALLELVPDRNGFLAELSGLGIPGVSIQCEQVSRCGVVGTHMRVYVNGREESDVPHDHPHPHDHSHPHNHSHSHDHSHPHENEPGAESAPAHSHSHSGPEDIYRLVSSLALSEKVKSNVKAVFDLLAGAESHVHGVPAAEIHFHEVGTMDAVADITAVCLLMDRVSPDRVIVSPINVGSGRVKCAHGILPVPAPAAAYLLRDIPIYSGRISGELCTPTGAALIRYFASEFGPMPAMRVRSIGYGMGTKEFEAANCVRAFLGESDGVSGEEVTELSCNIDDMTPEAIGFASELLMGEGALDVYTIPIGMKKSRPGVLFSVLCRPDEKEKFVRLIFKHTSTIGIREQKFSRYTLERSTATAETRYGPVRKKISTGYGVTRVKTEYEDAAALARDNGVSLYDVLSECEQ